MKKIFAIAVALAAFNAAPAFAQSASADEAYVEKAWADGQLDEAEKANIAQITTRGQIALAAKIAKQKFSSKDLAPTYAGTIGPVNQKASPWIPARATDWSRQADGVFKVNWALEAMADYDRDGKVDHAVIMTNGRQTAVMLHRSSNPQPMIIYKTDGIAAGMEIFAAGNRFYLSVPDVSPIALFLDKGKPAAAVLGD